MVLPQKDYYTVGLGGSNEGKRMKTVAKEFFDHVIGRDVENVKGAFIPTGKKLSLAALPANVLLAGDAAGFIDPITGEGIYYALRKGHGRQRRLPNVRATFLICTHVQQEDRRGMEEHQTCPAVASFIIFAPRLPRFVSSLGHHERFARFYLERLVSTYEFNYKKFRMVLSAATEKMK